MYLYCSLIMTYFKKRRTGSSARLGRVFNSAEHLDTSEERREARGGIFFSNSRAIFFISCCQVYKKTGRATSEASGLYTGPRTLEPSISVEEEVMI